MLTIISVVFMVLGGLLGQRLKSKIEHYSAIPLDNGMTGAEIADTMLKFYNINDVQIIQVPGQLTDHYNPQNKTVNLSPEVYSGRNISAAAVASHECGHAVQHATQYSMLQFRSAMVPIVNIAANVQQYIFMLGIGMLSNFGPTMLIFALIVFGVTTAFSLITLPVEFDASRRALAWLDSSRTLQGEKHDGAKDALFWAAMTYVCAAAASLVQFLYLLSRLMNQRR
jgi:uncharacterized protein